MRASTNAVHHRANDTLHNIWGSQRHSRCYRAPIVVYSRTRTHRNAFRGVQVQLLWARQQLLHGRSQLIAIGKQLSPAKDVQPQPGSRQGHHQTPDISDVPHSPGAHQRKQDVVILLPLVLVHCGNLQATSTQADFRALSGAVKSLEGTQSHYSRCDVMCGTLAGLCARHEHVHRRWQLMMMQGMCRGKKWRLVSPEGISKCKGVGSNEATGQPPRKDIAPAREAICGYALLSKTQQPRATHTYSTPHTQVMYTSRQFADCATTWTASRF